MCHDGSCKKNWLGQCVLSGGGRCLSLMSRIYRDYWAEVVFEDRTSLGGKTDR